jgi:transposase InsO family protein
MTEADVEITLQRAKEKFPEARPRIISDNGPQFIAKDFKEYIRISSMTHVRTRPYHPQSNGKVERYHKTLKQECIRPQVALSMDEAAKQIERFVDDYNHKRLHSSIGYVTPADKLSGREQTIFADRDRKLALAREQRAKNRQSARKKIRKENQAA